MTYVDWSWARWGEEDEELVLIRECETCGGSGGGL